MRIVWLADAMQQRLDAFEFMAERNPRAAIEHDEAISRHGDRLQSMPLRGRNGRVAGTRELTVAKTPYVIVYRIEDGRVEVLGVFHQSRQRD